MGRGACDAKGIIVAQMLAVDYLVQNRLVRDEDIGYLFYLFIDFIVDCMLYLEYKSFEIFV